MSQSQRARIVVMVSPRLTILTTMTAQYIVGEMDAGLEMVETPVEILPGPWHKTNEAGAELQSGDHCHQPLNAGAGH